MRKRVGLLLVVLVSRVLLNVLEANRYPDGLKVKLTGNIDKIERNISKCKIYLNQFLTEVEGNCYFSQREKIQVIGSVKSRLIENMEGNIYLSDAVIDKVLTEETRPDQRGSILQWAIGIREKIAQIYASYLPSEESAIVAGIVLGDKKGISGDLYERMVRSGTVHIAVASGFNLMVLSGSLMSWLFWICKRKWATMWGILISGGYMLMAGAEPPVLRAWIMVSMLLIGSAIGRRQHSSWALLLTAWLMLLADVGLWRSASFQLSVMASVGLMLVGPALTRYFEAKGSVLIQYAEKLGVVTTMATMLTTLPVIWWHFGRFNLMGLISNVVILPLVPALMGMGGLMLLWPQGLSWPVYFLAHLVVVLIGALG